MIAHMPWALIRSASLLVSRTPQDAPRPGARPEAAELTRRRRRAPPTPRARCPREARSLWGVRALVLWRPGPGPDLSLLSALALDVAWEPSLQALEGLIRGGAKGGMDLTQRPVPPRRLKIFSPTRLVTTRKTSHVPTPDPALCHMQHGAHSGRAWSPKAPRTCEGDAHDVRR